MRSLCALLLMFVGLASGQQRGITDAWIRSGAPASVRNVAPEVHDVHVGEGFVEVESAGLTLRSLAPWGQGGVPTAGPRVYRFRFPLRAEVAVKPEPASQGIVGAFLTGVPIYSPAAGPSWQDANIWHVDTMVKVAKPDLFTKRAARPSVIGYALDGYPVYAGGGERSSWVLRKMVDRRTLPDGTALPPGQEGPRVSAEYPLGTFLEDYEYSPGAGTLDAHNGRDAGQGYGYFATEAYPYLIGPAFRGVVPAAARCGGMELASVNARAGEAATLSLCTESPLLERVHEKLIHLIVVSEDQKDFAHLHPEQQASARDWKVEHVFPRAGKYRLYAEYTPAGGTPRVARFAVTVGQGREMSLDSVSAPEWVMMHHGELRAGEDVPFSFDVREPLEPYLGAWGHFVVMDAGGAEFLHAHPTEEMPAPDPFQHSHAQGPSPERVSTMIGFPRAGKYRLWAQFQRAGVVQTMAWDLLVKPAAVRTTEEPVTGAVAIRVTRNGYEPSRIPVKKGIAVRLAFTREDAANCGGTVVFADLGIRRELPAGRTTIVELPPSAREEIRFACGMGMLKGALVAVP